MIKNSDKKKIVVDVRASKVVRHWTEKAGGNFEVSVCWTIPIKLKMQAEPEIVFGGETSSHYVFPVMHESDDGILAALTFLQAISVKKESIDEINNKFKQEYFVLEETNFKMHDADEALKILKKLKSKYEPEGAQILEIDGLSVIFPEWAFNLRRSESEPLIRLNLEASSKKLFDEKKEEVVNLIKE
jgi:phosphomannomutase